ncbi:MAG TPA: MBL fold metallo-hydrolase [Kofleriaceae bacterium]|jgi:competence protein ComEC
MKSWIALVACVVGCGPAVHPNPGTIDPAFFQPIEGKHPDLKIASTAPDPSAPRMRVHLIDVGQGASTLVEFSCGAILIDTGGEANSEFDSTDSLLTYLDAFFASRPDLDKTLSLLLLTHDHIDHTRGANPVFARYHVKNVVTDGLTASSGGYEQGELIDAAKKAGIGVEDINANVIKHQGFTDSIIDPIKCQDSDPKIEVLWGAADRSDVNWDGRAYKNDNNHSVATKITLGSASIVITGDLELDGIEAMLERFKGTNALDADVYEVGHHGSYNATTKELLDAITPKIALIAMGPATRNESFSAKEYGHPRIESVELLEKALSGPRRRPVTKPIGRAHDQFVDKRITAPIYATGWDGDVMVTMFADGRIDVTTDKR